VSTRSGLARRPFLGAEEALMLAALMIGFMLPSPVAVTPPRRRQKPHPLGPDHWFLHAQLRPVFLRGDLPHGTGRTSTTIAPRGLYQHSTQNDGIFPNPGCYDAGEAARAVWRLYGSRISLSTCSSPASTESPTPRRRKSMIGWTAN
jgi:hypothetical protein